MTKTRKYRNDNIKINNKTKKKSNTIKNKNYTKKKKIYSLSFSQIIKEIDRIDKYFIDIENQSKESENSNIENSYDDQSIKDFFDDTYHELINPVIISGWLMFPKEMYEYIRSIEDNARIMLILEKLEKIGLYGTEQIQFEFPDTNTFPNDFFTFLRQYRSLVVIIENKFSELQNYDELLDQIDKIIIELLDFIKFEFSELSKVDNKRLVWISIILCQFSEMITLIENSISKDEVQKYINDILDFSLKQELIEISNIIKYYLESKDIE